MFWRIVKKVLSFADVVVRFTEGDQLHIKISLGGRVVLDKNIDVMPKV